MRKGDRVYDIRPGQSRIGVIVEINFDGSLVVDWGFRMEKRDGKIAVSARIEEVVENPFHLELYQGDDNDRLYF